MKPSVYVETSVVSYLAARQSRVTHVAARQEATHAWWAIARERFELHAFQPVIDEASQGDPKYTQKRLQDDAAHIAVAVTNGMGYLVTWNCRHIANAQRRKRTEAVCRRLGYEPTILCTPEELMGDE
jgi:hypothetical protein